MSPGSAHNNITVLLSQTYRSHTGSQAVITLNQAPGASQERRRGVAVQSADQFIALRRIFPCLISTTKSIPIEIKTAHTADTAVSGIGLRNEEQHRLTKSLMPTIGTRYLGKNTYQFQSSLIDRSPVLWSFVVSTNHFKNKIKIFLRESEEVTRHNSPLSPINACLLQCLSVATMMLTFVYWSQCCVQTQSSQPTDTCQPGPVPVYCTVHCTHHPGIPHSLCTHLVNMPHRGI